MTFLKKVKRLMASRKCLAGIALNSSSVRVTSKLPHESRRVRTSFAMQVLAASYSRR